VVQILTFDKMHGIKSDYVHLTLRVYIRV
jgi:hypothetical protein